MRDACEERKINSGAFKTDDEPRIRSWKEDGDAQEWVRWQVTGPRKLFSVKVADDFF